MLRARYPGWSSEYSLRRFSSQVSGQCAFAQLINRLLANCPSYQEKACNAASGTRIALATRTCRSAPRLHSAYTVAVLTPNRSATSRTFNSRSATRSEAAPAIEACSTGAANGELTRAIPCDGWTRPPAPTRGLPMLCERLLLSPNRVLLAPEP
jgi:hypothetical protein